MAHRLVVALVLGLSLLGAQAENRSGQAAPNHTLPAHSSPDLSFSLSENPAVEEIRSVRFFAEPLVPVGFMPSAEQNRQISVVLRQYSQRSAVDDFSALENFIADQPNSPWTPSLTLDLAMEYYNTGWYSKALATWEKAWLLLKPATEPAAKPLGDRAAGELACMYARLGRMKELENLLHSLEGRTLAGSAAEKVRGASEGLWAMHNRPETSFLCGPLALSRILASQNAGGVLSLNLRNAKSTTNGTSLTQVAGWSKQAGMDYQMAFREKGADLLMPAVVNWRAGHYTALIREEGGLYLLQDPTFGNDAWVTRRVLDEETSGYFVVPVGTLPPGWRPVSEKEGQTVWGKGTTSMSDPQSTTPNDGGTGGGSPGGGCGPGMCCGGGSAPASGGTGAGSGGTGGMSGSNGNGPEPGMAVADVLLMLVSLRIQDSPVGYTPPVGPAVRLHVTYNQRDVEQPTPFTFSNLGYQWTFNWLAFIADNPSTPSADVNYYTDGGGELPFTGYRTQTQTYGPQLKSQAILTRNSATNYTMLYPDGSQQIFGLPDAPTNATSRHVLLTQLTDPQGNSVHIGYDGSFRVRFITDAIGQVTTLSYSNTTDPLKITQVTDPFGRSANFAYDSVGRLTNITDEIGLVSQFSYDTTNINTITSMTTPYGTTSFAYGAGPTHGPTAADTGRDTWIETTYPNGEKERVQYSESSKVGIPNVLPLSVMPTNMPVVNINMIYRNTYYWSRRAYPTYNPTNFTAARIYHWLHNYPAAGETSGVLEASKEPLENYVFYHYKNQARFAETPDVFIGASSRPEYTGRVLDDGSEQITHVQYNDLGHATNTVDPVGRSMTYLYAANLVDLLEVRQTTGTNKDLLARYLYNSQHLPVAVWDAAGQSTTNTYNQNGQLLTTSDPLNETTTLKYATNGYLLSTAGPLAGTNDTIRFTYDSVGRVNSVTGTDGYNLNYTYDNLDRLTHITYPDGTSVAYTYSNLDLVILRDRLGRKTLSTYDSLRQLITEQDALNRITRFEYCSCGAVSDLIDPMGRRTSWEHDIEGRLTAKQYADGSRITYTYENTTSRLKSIEDEKGQFKNYSYLLDNNLRQVLYPNAQVFTPTVIFDYDSNYNRRTSMSDGIGTTTWHYFSAGVFGALMVSEVDGPWTNETVTCQYDQLGRITNCNINNMAEIHSYDAMGRVTNIINALGSFKYDYDGATDRLLDAAYPNGQTSHYDYYDNIGDRLLQRITHSKPDSSLISRFSYSYNAVGNVTNWVQELGVETANWNITYDSGDQVLAVEENMGMSNTVSYSFAYDPSGNRLLDTTNGVSETFAYNSLNELIYSSSGTRTNISYEWDAEQRLTAINNGIIRSEFTYDGLDRRSRIVEKLSRVAQLDYRYTWFGFQLCEERNASYDPIGLFFSQGEIQGTTNIYYSRDHLGSIRDENDYAITSLAVFAYDPFGVQSIVENGFTTHFGFTGHFRHGVSGLLLAPFRAYDPTLAKWLSRDPMNEKAGLNLYGLAGNDPINTRDPLGLTIWKCTRPVTGFEAGASGGTGRHAYLWDSTTHQACGTQGMFGYGHDPMHPEAGPPFDTCVPVPGSIGQESQVMACCKSSANSGVYFPPFKDCHTHADDCLTKNGLVAPAAPQFDFSSGVESRSTGCGIFPGPPPPGCR